MYRQTCLAVFVLLCALLASAVNLEKESGGSASWQLNPGTSHDRSLLQLKQESGRTNEQNETAVVVPVHCVMAAAVGSGAVVAAAIPGILAAAGFGAVGVTEGSLAATWQSSFGAGVAKGSLFATLQSLAMGGMGAGNAIVVSGSLAATFTSFCAQVKNLSHGAADTATKAGHWLSNLTVKVNDQISRVLPVVGNATADALQGLEGFVSETLREAPDAVSNATDSLTNVIHSAAPQVQNSASHATQTVVDSMTDATATIRAWFSGSSEQSYSFQVSSFTLLPLCAGCAVHHIL
mmetsp:Transcript_69469/g.122869  ORF Transcript_69469/g.122869 Transcript_69469/m.122869 type:complete len:293 (+) Transcript_69469:88-966(+)